MKIFTTKGEIIQYLLQKRSAGKTIGLVPTMGALHNGHISLLATAKTVTDEVVCSIFVNPTQFNDPKDLEKYPRPIESDIKKLESAGCDILFNPPVSEIYAANEPAWHLDIGPLESLLEGKFRPGHYQGVTQVVFKLFDIIKPDMAFFGQKDYQQFLVISKMVQLLNLPVKMVMCPIVREPGGLAMSSRNVHLSADEKQNALALSQLLQMVKDNFATHTLPELKQLAAGFMEHQPELRMEYFELADGDTLYPAAADTEKVVALVAAWAGKTRLIDNMILK
ncbi:pantoate--beta-alanine ligase [Mucilaginibacter sp. AW1-3]